jgi:hypothetical protein
MGRRTKADMILKARTTGLKTNRTDESIFCAGRMIAFIKVDNEPRRVENMFRHGKLFHSFTKLDSLGKEFCGLGPTIDPESAKDSILLDLVSLLAMKKGIKIAISTSRMDRMVLSRWRNDIRSYNS